MNLGIGVRDHWVGPMWPHSKNVLNFIISTECTFTVEGDTLYTCIYYYFVHLMKLKVHKLVSLTSQSKGFVSHVTVKACRHLVIFRLIRKHAAYIALYCVNFCLVMHE